MIKSVFENSKWIWYTDSFTPNSYGEFADTFLHDGKKTTVRISVRGDYVLYVNGEFTECNQFADFEHYKVYDEIDITDKLCVGENRICILVWYFGKSGMRHNTPMPGLIYEVVCGDKIVAASGEATLSRKSRAYVSGFERKISIQLGYSFAYNSVLEDEWLTSDTKDFGRAYVLTGTKEFYRRPVEKLCLGNGVVGSVTKTENSYLVDFGYEITGLAKIAFCTECENTVNVAYGEVLCDGHVKRIIDGRDFSFDYTAKRGRNEYVNRMFRVACRYIEISCEGDIDIEEISVIPQYYPVKAKKFSFDEKLDGQIYEICLNTLRLSMMEHYVDCPWREQCLYAFDARNQMLTGYTAFESGNFEYARANLLLMSKDNREDKLLSICFPSAEDLTIPSFSLYYVIAVYEYMKNTGDFSLGFEVVEKIESILGVFFGNTEDGLVCCMNGKNHWNFYDWSPYCSSNIGAFENGPDMIINCIAVMALEAYGKICEMLCRKRIYGAELSETIRREAHERFFNNEKGVYFIRSKDEETTELVNALAVLSGIADNDTAANICEMLACGSLVSCSLSMKVFKYDVLLKIGGEKYREAVLDEIRKTYKIMLDAGSTTVWEEIHGAEAFGKAGSLCHGWSAVPIHYYRLLGVAKSDE